MSDAIDLMESFGGGWIPWIHQPPFHERAVEALRASWEYPETLIVAKIDPAFNVAGLYWRPLP